MSHDIIPFQLVYRGDLYKFYENTNGIHIEMFPDKSNRVPQVVDLYDLDEELQSRINSHLYPIKKDTYEEPIDLSDLQ